MTREQRLDLLKQIEQDIYRIGSSLSNEAKSYALRLTIEELEQELCDCDDFLSREERLKMLIETGEFDFLKDIPPEKIWKLTFMFKFIGDTESEK